MESPSHISFETNQSSLVQGYSTPPRSHANYKPSTIDDSFSELFHHSKLLTSTELRRRFSPLNSFMKKRRQHQIRKTDSIVPLKRDLAIPRVLEKLFDYDNDFSTKSINEDDSVVPISGSSLTVKVPKRIACQPVFDCFISNSMKIEKENLFSISESTMKLKLKTLLHKK